MKKIIAFVLMLTVVSALLISCSTVRNYQKRVDNLQLWDGDHFIVYKNETFPSEDKIIKLMITSTPSYIEATYRENDNIIDIIKCGDDLYANIFKENDQQQRKKIVNADVSNFSSKSQIIQSIIMAEFTTSTYSNPNLKFEEKEYTDNNTVERYQYTDGDKECVVSLMIKPDNKSLYAQSLLQLNTKDRSTCETLLGDSQYLEFELTNAIFEEVLGEETITVEELSAKAKESFSRSSFVSDMIDWLYVVE